jgi:hypothetical protein
LNSGIKGILSLVDIPGAKGKPKNSSQILTPHPLSVCYK